MTRPWGSYWVGPLPPPHRCDWPTCDDVAAFHLTFDRDGRTGPGWYFCTRHHDRSDFLERCWCGNATYPEGSGRHVFYCPLSEGAPNKIKRHP